MKFRQSDFCFRVQAQVAQPVARGARVGGALEHSAPYADDGDVFVPRRVGDADTHVVAAEHIVAAAVGELQGAVVQDDGYARRQQDGAVDHPDGRAVGVLARNGDRIGRSFRCLDRQPDAPGVASRKVIGRDRSPGEALGRCGRCQQQRAAKFFSDTDFHKAYYFEEGSNTKMFW